MLPPLRRCVVGPEHSRRIYMIPPLRNSVVGTGTQYVYMCYLLYGAVSWGPGHSMYICYLHYGGVLWGPEHSTYICFLLYWALSWGPVRISITLNTPLCLEGHKHSTNIYVHGAVSSVQGQRTCMYLLSPRGTVQMIDVSQCSGLKCQNLTLKITSPLSSSDDLRLEKRILQPDSHLHPVRAGKDRSPQHSSVYRNVPRRSE